MIRDCNDSDFDAILAIINDAADAYRGIIPADRWKEPYMPADELRGEIGHGVSFSGFEEAGGLVGVMGVQNVADVALIRHAYVRGVRQGRGIGGEILRHLMARIERPLLIGTWAAARWAVGFYEKHGFSLIEGREKDRVLRLYWSIPDRQIETSVVLADPRWLVKNPQSRAEETDPDEESSGAHPEC
jgi:N-acetylglutamate synthase-like GNAT family acetyltransferase